LCKAEWHDANDWRRKNRTASAPRKAKPAPAPALRSVETGPRQLWRPAGIERCPAKGGPDDPRWTVA
jgi:hypothetical protein